MTKVRRFFFQNSELFDNHIRAAVPKLCVATPWQIAELRLERQLKVDKLKKKLKIQIFFVRAQ
jgi:hypothetical protein